MSQRYVTISIYTSYELVPYEYHIMVILYNREYYPRCNMHAVRT